MAEYCTVEDVSRYGVNAAAIGALSSDEHIKPVIKAQSGVIDGYLRLRYTLPLLTWGDDIRRACAILVACDVLTTRGAKPGENPDDKPIFDRCDEVLAWLKLIADGKVAPDVTDSSPIQTAGGPRMGKVASNQQRGWFAEDASRAGPFQGRRR